MNQFKNLLNLPENIVLDQQVQDKLCLYLDKLWAANKELNLFSRKMSAESLVNGHLIDSLLALPYFPQTKALADLGSGGGLPGIVLAICRPETKLFLYEKSLLKRKFLTSLTELCPNIEIMGNIDPKGFPAEIELVTARAFKPINVTIEMTRAYYNQGGKYLLYKGRLEKIQQEISDAKLPESAYRLQKLESDIFDERYLVFINQ